MKYRHFGRLDWEASVLGFGAMRLPTIGNDYARIDEPEAVKMIRYSVDNGVNYIDTAYPYHGGNSETLLSKALEKGYRRKVKIATKMPTWLIHSQADMDKYLDEQLDRLKMDKVDFYLLHGMTKERWRELTKLEVFKWAEKKIEEEKFDYLGFSFHDEYSVFKKIVDAYDNWDFCQILYNYMDSTYQAGTRGLKYAASKGLAVVVMEPIAGGRLAMKPHKDIEAIWGQADVKRTLAEWALLWVWDHPEVTVALSGMSSMKQVKENVKTASISEPMILSNKERSLFKRVSEKYRQLGFVQCTKCRYCQPCPNGVNVPEIIELYNEFYMKDRAEEVKRKYAKQITSESSGKRCTKCGKCEELCPQHLPIKETMSRSVSIFEQEN
ncbi:MAG TPA: aldo/keto reductase [Candidatus Bathyarchaeia archaeon]|jgi:predicted aldo/keto reductase-like oxidoreductase|nr:aldo/keto reductase [Candidatus Bathyarchaeia archaeon]